MKIEFFDLVRIITAFQLVLVALFLFTQKKGKSASHLILALFLLSEASYVVSGIFFGLTRVLKTDWLNIFYLNYPFILLFGPTLFFYTRLVIVNAFKFKITHLLHLVPFIFFLILNPLKFHIASTDIEILHINIKSYYERFIIFGFIHLHILSYLIAAIVRLRQYRAEIKNRLSSTELINLSWLRFILTGFLIIWSVETVFVVLNMSMCILMCSLKMIIVGLLFIMANLIVFWGLKQPAIFWGNNHKPKYEKCALSPAEREKYLQKLISIMQSEQPYLQPNLTLNDLATRVAIPPHHLSQILNSCLHQNFFDFVNAYRIEASKQLLIDSNSRKKTVLEILYQTGFNSKSVFNTAFKKHTGMTPTQFRNLHNS